MERRSVLPKDVSLQDVNTRAFTYTREEIIQAFFASVHRKRLVERGGSKLYVQASYTKHTYLGVVALACT
jgi:hypothetical protein